MISLNQPDAQAASAPSPWWMRFLPSFLAAQPIPGAATAETTLVSDNVSPVLPATAHDEGDYDAVFLPPGATAEDADSSLTNTDNPQQSQNSSAGGTAAANAAAASPERILNQMDPKPDTTTTPADNAAAGAEATPPAANVTNTAVNHVVLTAALAAGIDTEAKFAQMTAEATAGREALASARADANAAAVAFYGQKNPEKIKAAEQLIAGTSNLTQLSLLADNWHAGAPGAGSARTENGAGVRQSRPNGPGPQAVTRENGGSADEAQAPPRNSGTVSVYDQYNRPAAGTHR